MTKERITLKRGDWVEVRPPDQILSTLDKNGSMDGVPFMPEMLVSCGRRFRVMRRATKTCVDVIPWLIREFKTDDIVLLENVRCSGEAHDGCQRACMVFWKEAWLRKVASDGPDAPVAPDQIERLRGRLKTKADGGLYFCQSTEMLKVTRALTLRQKALKCFSDVWCGNYSWLKMVRLVVAPGRIRLIRLLGGGRSPRGTLAQTPTQTLGLQAGDLVEVRSPAEILQTLDQNGSNRGLRFGEPMLAHCGRQYCVRSRLDRMIIESTGEMRVLKNTVVLDEVTCACKWVIGGCPRCGFDYWREIWLKRASGASKPPECR